MIKPDVAKSITVPNPSGERAPYKFNEKCSLCGVSIPERTNILREERTNNILCLRCVKEIIISQ